MKSNKKLHPVLVGKTKETIAKLSGEPTPSKTEKRLAFTQRLNPKDENSLIKYKTDQRNATLGPTTKINKGGTTIGIVGGKLGKSSREMRKETGYGRAQRVKMAAAATDQTVKRVRATSPTKTGMKLRKIKKDVKESLKKGTMVLSAQVTGRGGSGGACKTRQGKGNF